MIGSVLTSTYSGHVTVTGLTDAVAAKVKASFAVASHLGAPIASRADTAFVTAMHVALLTAAGAALIAAAAVVFLLRRGRDGAPAAESNSFDHVSWGLPSCP